MRYWGVALLAVSVALGQEDVARLRSYFEVAIKQGAIDRANQLMVDALMIWLAQDTGEARKLCGTAANHVRKTADAKRDDWSDLCGKLVKVGNMCVEAGGQEDADAQAALAEALLCRARFCDDPARNPKAEHWTRAAELYVKVDQLDPDEGKALQRAVAILQEGATTSVATEGMGKRLAELVETGTRKYPRNEYFRELAHRNRLQRVAKLLEENRRDGRDAAEAYLNQLAHPPVSAGGFNPTYYNDMVTFAETHKLHLKFGYKARQESWGSNYLVFSAPEGKRWKWKGNSLFQYGVDGNYIRHFSFYTYKWTTAYVLDGREFGGDNIKGLARLGEADVLTVVQQVKKRRNLRRKRLNRYCPHSQALTIGGLDDKGKFVCYHLYYMKAKKTKLKTFKITIFEAGDYKDLDPEAQFVLDSIREP